MSRWLNTTWYTHTMEQYPTRKRNNLLIHILTWRNLLGTVLSEKKLISKGYILTDWEMENRSVVARIRDGEGGVEG